MTIEDIRKNNCSGCSLCANECMQKCISMQSDEEGFLFPIINKDECTECGLCYKKCPINQEYEFKFIPRYFASAIADKNELMESSSGGVFIELAKQNQSECYGGIFL